MFSKILSMHPYLHTVGHLYTVLLQTLSRSASSAPKHSRSLSYCALIFMGVALLPSFYDQGCKQFTRPIPSLIHFATLAVILTEIHLLLLMPYISHPASTRL